MKKIFCACLISILLFSLSISAFAEVDLSSMSVDELNELRMQIENEIVKKGGDLQIGSGTYIGGEDIAPGTYELKVIGDTLTTYMLYPAEGNFVADYITDEAYTRITINDGDKLELIDPCFLRKAAKIGF